MKVITPENLYETIRCGEGIEISGAVKVLFDPKHQNDDILDVSALFPYADPDRCKVDFRKLPPALLGPGRAFARLMMFYGSAAATAQNKINALVLLDKKMTELGLQANINTLSMEEINAVVNSSNISDQQSYRLCITVYNMINIFKSIYKNEFYAMDLKELALLATAFGRVIRKGKNAGKTPDVDEDYFDILNLRLPGIIWDRDIPYNYRLTAALILLEMWVGLRRSELFRLTKDALIVRKTTNDRHFTFLKYGVPKLSHGGRIEVYNETYMLPAAVSAFDALLALRDENKKAKKSDLLVVYEGESDHTESLYSYYARRLFYQYFPDITVGEQNWSLVKQHYVKQCGIVYYPTVTQFRVHLCGFLYQQGVKHHIIEIGMSHLSNTMTAYYHRVKDSTFQQEQSIVDRKIRTDINNDFDIVDHDELGEDLLKELILYWSKYKVYKDKFKEVVKKGKSYEYEACRYADKLNILIETQIQPTFDYLEKKRSAVGDVEVLKTHPMLKNILPNLETIKSDIDVCKRNLKPYLKTSEDIPKLSRQA